jgi:uncharacterized RDD family membrane protein YckC
MSQDPRTSLPAMGGDLITGEAVLLELRLAKLPSRGVAELLDLLVMYVALLLLAVIGALSGLNDSLDSAAGSALALVAFVGIFVGYPVLFETLSRGRSLGKMAMGLRVVREDGGPIHFRHAFVRGLLSVLEIYATFGTIAILTSLVSAKGKRVGDFLAGTVVVRERVPNAAAPMAAMPPILASWAATLELSRLPDDLALSARQFLARARDLSPSVRSSMGSQIAYDVSRFVAPAPPQGCPPEAYLTAVLAERRRRDEARYGASTAQAPYVARAQPTQDYQAFAPPQPPGVSPPPDPADGFTVPF